MSWVLVWSTKGNLWLKLQLAMHSIPRKSGTVCLPQKTKIIVVKFPVVALNYLPIFHEGGGLIRKLFCVSPFFCLANGSRQREGVKPLSEFDIDRSTQGWQVVNQSLHIPPSKFVPVFFLIDRHPLVSSRIETTDLALGWMPITTTLQIKKVEFLLIHARLPFIENHKNPICQTNNLFILFHLN